METRNSKLLKYKKLLTKDFLYNEYINNKKSISQLKKETGKDWNTLNYYMQFYRIPLRTHKEQATISSPGGQRLYENLFNKDYLVREYLVNKKGIKDIAKIHNVDWGTVKRYLVKYGLTSRSSAEQKLMSHPPKEFASSGKIKSFIDGLLLGDASIPKRKDGVKPWCLSQACKHREYLEYIKKRFENAGIICSPILSRWIKDDRAKNQGYIQHFLQTRRYKTFEIFRKRWYPKGKKIVPLDLEITPDFLLQSYLGDGNFYREIKLCLDAFTKADILFLSELITKKLSIHPRLIKANDKYELAIKKSDTIKFLNYIGNCPVKCYGYKWKDNESEEAKERKRLNARLAYHKNVQSKRIST